MAPVQEPPKKRIAANGERLPDPIPEGELFKDTAQNVWRLGRSIGLGGFGEIYLGTVPYLSASSRPYMFYVRY